MAKVIVISIAVGSACNEVTHILRKGHGKVTMISIIAGSACKETRTNYEGDMEKSSSSASQQEAHWHAMRSRTI